MTASHQGLPCLTSYKPNFNKNIWAVTWDFQQCGILTNVDSDEPVVSPFKLRNSKWCSVSSLINTHRIFKRLAKALIRLRVYAGWSESLLGAHTILMEITCCGSIILLKFCYFNQQPLQWIIYCPNIICTIRMGASIWHKEVKKTLKIRCWTVKTVSMTCFKFVESILASSVCVEPDKEKRSPCLIC